MYTAYAKFSKPKGQDHRFSLVKQAAEVVKIAPRMHQNPTMLQCQKIFRGGATPRRLDPRAFSARLLTNSSARWAPPSSTPLLFSHNSHTGNIAHRQTDKRARACG